MKVDHKSSGFLRIFFRYKLLLNVVLKRSHCVANYESVKAMAEILLPILRSVSIRHDIGRVQKENL